MFCYFRIWNNTIPSNCALHYPTSVQRREAETRRTRRRKRKGRVKIWTDTSVFPRPRAHGGWSPFILFSFFCSLGSPKDRLNKWFPLQPSTPGMVLMIHTQKAEARFRNQFGLHSETLIKTNKEAMLNWICSSEGRHRTPGHLPALQKRGVATHACNVSTAETGAGRSQVQNYPQLHREPVAILSYVRPASKRTRHLLD